MEKSDFPALLFYAGVIHMSVLLLNIYKEGGQLRDKVLLQILDGYLAGHCVRITPALQTYVLPASVIYLHQHLIVLNAY